MAEMRTHFTHRKGETGNPPPDRECKPAGRSAEVPEGRPVTKRNPSPTPMTGTQQPEKMLSGLERIRAVAEKDRKVRFTNLLHHITIDLLRESYRELNRTAKPGVDDETWKSYGVGLEERL